MSFSSEFLEKHRALILSRMETEIVEVQGHEMSVLREEGAPYREESAPITAVKAFPASQIAGSNIKPIRLRWRQHHGTSTMAAARPPTR